jgi:hypothetical protein
MISSPPRRFSTSVMARPPCSYPISSNRLISFARGVGTDVPRITFLRSYPERMRI